MVFVLCPNRVSLILKLVSPEFGSSGTPKTGWFSTLNASVRKVSLVFSVRSNSLAAEVSQLKYAGALNAFDCKFPTSLGCGLQKPPVTAGVQPPNCGEDGAPVPSELTSLGLMMKTVPLFWTNVPTSPLICWWVRVATAVLLYERHPPRLNVAYCETIENGAPLCHMKIDPVCHPLPSNPSIRPGDPNPLWTRPIGNTSVKFA